MDRKWRDAGLKRDRVYVGVIKFNLKKADEPHRTLESLMEYVRIAQHRPQVESYRRQPDQCWVLTESEGLESCVRLDAIDCELALAEIYEKVEFAGDGGY